MLNIELAVLQNLEQEEWATLSEISAQTRIQEQAAEQAHSGSQSVQQGKVAAQELGD